MAPLTAFLWHRITSREREFRRPSNPCLLCETNYDDLDELGFLIVVYSPINQRKSSVLSKHIGVFFLVYLSSSTIFFCFRTERTSLGVTR